MTATWSKSSRLWIRCATIITVQPRNDSRITLCTLASVSATTNTDGIKWKPITHEHTCLLACLRSRFCSSLAEPGLDRIAASGPVIECYRLGLNPESLRPYYGGLPQQSPKYRQIVVHRFLRARNYVKWIGILPNSAGEKKRLLAKAADTLSD